MSKTKSIKDGYRRPSCVCSSCTSKTAKITISLYL